MIAYVSANNWLMSLFAWTLDFNTGAIGFSSATSATTDISGGLDNLLLTNGDNLLLTSSAQDVLLLTSA